MIYDKARMAKLSGLLTETSHKGIKNSMANQFGGGKEEGDPWLDGEVTTEGADDDSNESIMRTEGEDGMGDGDEEKAVREMIRTELRKAKKGADADKKEENAVREAVRKEIRSVLKSRGVTIGGTGFGFRR